MPEQEYSLDISINTILKIFIAIFVLYIIYISKTIVLWFFFGLAISILLDPAIDLLRRLKIPKIISVIIIYSAIFGILGLLAYLSMPIFIYELRQFSHNLPDYFNQINPLFKQFGFNIAQDFNDFVNVMVNTLQEKSGSFIKGLVMFFGELSSTLVILAIAFFLSLEDNGPERFLSLIAPKKYESYVASLFDRAQRKVAAWFLARILACLFVGIASFIVFYLFSIKYIFTLSLIAGVLNFIPFIGPLITLFLLIVIVPISTGSWLAALYIGIAFVIVQEIENKIITPMLMKKFINIPAVVVLISLLVGTKVFGFLGAIFSVPVFGIMYEFIKDFLEKRKEEY